MEENVYDQWSIWNICLIKCIMVCDDLCSIVKWCFRTFTVRLRLWLNLAHFQYFSIWLLFSYVKLQRVIKFWHALFSFWSVDSEDKSSSVATENGCISSFRWNICYWFRYVSYQDAWKSGINAGSNYFCWFS